MNPEDLGCQRWRPLKKAVEQRTRLVRESNETNERLLALRAELPQAEKADSEAFAAALAAGKPEPERKSEQISAQIENMARRADACSVAIENAENEIRRLRNENGPAWRREQFRTIAKKHAAYEKGIRELEEAREALADEVALAGWIVDGRGIPPVNDSLIDRDAAAEGRPPLSFSRVLHSLREDAGEIATHVGESEVRMPWEQVKAHVEALVGQGLSRKEALQRAGRMEWGGE
jgi:hypothetical protein